MSASTIKVTTMFEDGEKRTVSIGEIATTAVNEQNIRDQVALLNNATQREENYPGFTSAFVSSTGANFSKISAVQIVTSDRIVIF